MRYEGERQAADDPAVEPRHQEHRPSRRCDDLRELAAAGGGEDDDSCGTSVANAVDQLVVDLVDSGRSRRSSAVRSSRTP